MTTHPSSTGRGLALPGLVLGLGLGGFVDGIVLHQLLEWHHMLSGWYPDTAGAHMRINMVADGLFHLACLLLVTVGLVFLVRSARHLGGPAADRRLSGWMLAGWGVFNLVEGTVDHQILGVHHVRSGPYQTAFDVAFLVFGALLVLVGLALARSGRRHPT
jgi:uncharacterized membrane protein